MIKKIGKAARRVDRGLNVLYVTYKKTPRTRNPIELDATAVDVAATAGGGAKLEAFTKRGESLTIVLTEDIVEAIAENSKDRLRLFPALKKA